MVLLGITTRCQCHILDMFLHEISYVDANAMSQTWSYMITHTNAKAISQIWSYTRSHQLKDMIFVP
ncbi:Replicase polyprotein 1ab [Gossypium arboreum]|uniref:Replicase polyprotein 1ab n=1 Tax=Gossypium arboreum TaxID=29729 RepID=A0A0B0N644_GOSAR|nr:Replicase polyprotein 1ab [Gossypium arboreum]